MNLKETAKRIAENHFGDSADNFEKRGNNIAAELIKSLSALIEAELAPLSAAVEKAREVSRQHRAWVDSMKDSGPFDDPLTDTIKELDAALDKLV